MSLPNFLASESITFEEAITLTQNLLGEWEEEKLSENQLEQGVISLVKSLEGARGFFVTYLTDERSFIDSPSPVLLKALESSPEIVAELLVKNVVMSTAMLIHHQRQNNPDLAQGSARVKTRSSALLKGLKIPQISSKIDQMLESLTTGGGNYQGFLERWGYDSEQKQGMRDILNNL